MDSCSQTTELSSMPWWAVDLGDNATVGHVYIVNRADCCQGMDRKSLGCTCCLAWLRSSSCSQFGLMPRQNNCATSTSR